MANPKPGDKNYRGPVHEAWRATGLQGVFDRPKRTSPARKQVKVGGKGTAGGTNPRRAARQERVTRLRSKGRSYAQALRMTTPGYGASARYSEFKSKSGRAASPKSSTPTRRQRAVGTAARRVQARNPGMSRKQARAKGRQIVRKRG